MDHQAFAQLLGNYGEFVGAIAVVLTLIYLAIQVRQNTRWMKAAVRHQLSSLTQELLLGYAEHSALLAKVWKPEPPTDLSPAGAWEVGVVISAQFRNWEAYRWQHQAGLLESEVWDGIVNDIRNNATSPWVVAQWRGERNSFPLSLQKVIDPIFLEQD